MKGIPKWPLIIAAFAGRCASNPGLIDKPQGFLVHAVS